MSCLNGHCGELVVSENLITSESKSVVARVGKNKECIVEKYTARKHGGLSNIYYSDGKKGKVVQIKIKGRNGKQGIYNTILSLSLSESHAAYAPDHII